jgi:phosphoribosylformylglycinamidine cyclo-ligase
LHYAVHVTGHGWRKLMRAARELTYVIETLPAVPAVLDFMRQSAGMSDSEAYGTFNMGAGLALYAPESAAADAIRVAGDLGFTLRRVGHVRAGPRAVEITPLRLRFEGASLQIRPT